MTGEKLNSKKLFWSINYYQLLLSSFTLRFLAGIPSLWTRSLSSLPRRYGLRLNTRSIAHTSWYEKVLRCQFFDNFSEGIVICEWRLEDLTKHFRGSLGTKITERHYNLVHFQLIVKKHAGCFWRKVFKLIETKPDQLCTILEKSYKCFNLPGKNFYLW